MGNQVPTSIFAAILAAVVAFALLGAFLNKGLKERFRPWWRGLSLHPFETGEGASSPEASPAPSHGHPRAGHGTSAHRERKVLPSHRSG